MRLPIGISDFSKLLAEANTPQAYTFVDKSLLVRDFIQEGAEVVLWTRPRRFGKTLNLSMLYHYFSCTQPEGPDLFDGLKIKQTSHDYLQHQNRYPVIFISFKDIKKDNAEEAFDSLRILLEKSYLAHLYLLDSQHLSSTEKELFQRILQKTANLSEVSTSLQFLSEWLHRHYGQKAIILIDEYDAPIHSAYVGGYYSEMIGFMRGLFSAALKDNPHLYKAALTGILRVAKENIFSGLNNLKVYSFLHPKYAPYFGFTEPEVKDLFQQSNCPHELEAIKHWYNGYQVDDQTLYNPWSILNCLSENGRLAPYWINTSDNALIQQLLTGTNSDIQQDFESLIQGKPIEAALDTFLNFRNMENNRISILTLLCMAGYLNAVNIRLVEGDSIYQMRIPNQEVRIVYRRIITQWLSGNPGPSWLIDTLDDLQAGHMEAFAYKLQKIAINIFSYHDVKGRTPESFFHGFVLGLVTLLQNTHHITSNREAGHGRYDIALLPKPSTENKGRPAILFELKSINDASDAALETAANAALAQIHTQAYDAELLERGFASITKIGVAFCGKHLRCVYEKTS